MKDRPGPTLLELAGIGIMAALCVAVGVGGGYWLGTVSGAGNAATFGGLAVGCAAAVATAYSKIKRYL